MTRLRLRTIAILALLGMVAALSAPAMAYDPRSIMLPSLEEAQNIMEYGSIVHDPLSRYVKSFLPEDERYPLVDNHVDLPDNVRMFEQPAKVPVNAKDTAAFAMDTPRIGGGTALAPTGGAVSTQPVGRDTLRDTLNDVNRALGIDE